MSWLVFRLLFPIQYLSLSKYMFFDQIGVFVIFHLKRLNEIFNFAAFLLIIIVVSVI